MCMTISSFTLATLIDMLKFATCCRWMTRVAHTIEIRTMTRTGRGNLCHFPLKVIGQIRCTRSLRRMAPCIFLLPADVGA